MHRHKKSIVSQREVSSDTESYKVALRASLRQSPDVILLGEMRDYETINIAMTAAETGHLVFSTLHTLGAANAVDRIIDVFPANQQRQIIVQLASVLNAVVSQQLLPDKEGKLIPAFELMTVNRAIKNMIRDNKVHQIDGLIGSSGQEKMFSMDSYITKLYKEGKITRETALDYATAPLQCYNVIRHSDIHPENHRPASHLMSKVSIFVCNTVDNLLFHLAVM